LIRKTGLLGGTFDPVHNGHLALAEAAGEVCNLDEIILLPAAVPPHKQDRTVTDFSHRAAMLKIAVHNSPSLHVSTIEKLLPYPSFTIDTLNYLKTHSAAPVELFFITGADTFLDILSWKKYMEVLQATNFIVFLREGSDKKELQAFIKSLDFTTTDGSSWYSENLKTSIYCSTLSLPTVSSSEIRDLVSQEKPTKHLTSEGVSDYITDNRLYTF
jgi:nicotinate-nucleotide adenylyltransferase